jgi:ribonuclease HII
MPRSRETGAALCNFEYEMLAIAQGYRVIAGCDEAGRGALIGPVYAAAVILDPTALIPGLNDSKKLTAPQRESLAVQIRVKAVAWRVVSVSASEVDAINVYQASRVGMLRALKALVPMPDFILTDAMPLRENGADFPISHRSLIHGDALSITIAAASILAKVERDAHMMKMHEAFPHYGLAKNKGYGTPDHLDALARLGPCTEHRKTYQPVKDCLLPLFTAIQPV